MSELDFRVLGLCWFDMAAGPVQVGNGLHMREGLVLECHIVALLL